MRKVNYFLYLILLLFSFFLIVSWYDNSNKDAMYNSYYDKDNKQVINISSKVQISAEQIKEINNISYDYDIIIEKRVFDESNDVTIHYLNLKDFTCVENILNVNIKDENINEISTLVDEGSGIFIKKDFLDNDRHIFKFFDLFIDENSNYTGQYIIYYDSQQEYNDFLTDISNYLNISDTELLSNGFSLTVTSFSQFINIYIIIFILLVFSLFISSLFFICKRGNEIGIYKLLGFSAKDICKNIILKENKFHMITTIILYLILNLIIKNNDIKFMIYSALIFVLVNILNMITTIVSIIVIQRKIKLSDLVKGKKLTNEIIKFNMFFKIVLFGTVLTFTLFLGINLKLLFERKQELDSFVKYIDYGVFSQFYQGDDINSFIGSSDELDISEMELFKYLEQNYDVVYADFRNYFPKNREEENFYNSLTANGNKRYKYGKIDSNYLLDLGLIDVNTGNIIMVEREEQGNVFLIPESKQQELEQFKSFYYEYYEEKKTDQFIVYRDIQIPSLSPEIASDTHYLIDAPILKVVTINNIELREVSVYGVGYDTPLKIKFSNLYNKYQFYDDICMKLKELNLNDNLNVDTIFTFSELFNNEINEISQQIFSVVSLLILLIFLYIYVLVQSIDLYLKDSCKEVAIKKLNGFDDLKIFKVLVINELALVNLITIIIFIIFHKSYFISEMFIFGLLINFIQIVFLTIVIKFKFKNFVIKTIKGGNI